MIANKRTASDKFYNKGMDKSYDEVFSVICQNVEITVTNQRFVYFIDSGCVMDTTKGYRYENLTPDYQKVLTGGLNDLKYSEAECTNTFCKSYNGVIDGMIELSQRIVNRLEEQKPDNYTEKIEWFARMVDKQPAGLEEAIQRLLFVNQIFWQTDHRLVGLGAWDLLLEPFYTKEVKNGTLIKEEAVGIIQDLMDVLHDNYEYKSNVLMGDTGQIFVLGYTDAEGNYHCNEVTYLILEALKNRKYPDPKVLLRINKDTPIELLKLAIDSVASGIGSPLFANDEVIIPKLIEFGIEPQHACYYTTSACWEPLIGGMSTSMNNMTVLNYMRSLDNFLNRERLSEITDFARLKQVYLQYLKRNLNAVKRVLQQPRFQYNPLLSVFTRGCYESKKDVSEGGAIYKNVGITSVAMGNTINALMNIKKYVFERKELTLLDVKQMLASNFEGDERYGKYCEILKKSSRWYGTDEEEIIDLTNEILHITTEHTKDFQNYLGGRLKFGLSGSAYMDAAREFPASFDGRKRGEPFAVHISNENNGSYTEIVNFAGRMDYGENRFNGNVVDLMMNPDYMQKNKEKFVDFIIAAVYSGFFEMQMNVVSSKILMEAKENPDAHPGLIVRVWGFSSYFNDLPEEYKEVLIRRALQNEAVC